VTKLTRLVLNAIADDYEDLEIILVDVGKWAEEDGITFGVDDVRASLVELVETGMAKAFEYSYAAQNYEKVSIPCPSDITEDHWFHISEAGKQAMHEFPREQ
jgi:hypothetical protein